VVRGVVDAGLEFGEPVEEREEEREEWRNGGMEEWRNGGMEEWRNGEMEEWKNGGMDEWREYLCLVVGNSRGSFKNILKASKKLWENVLLSIITRQVSSFSSSSLPFLFP
jgi:hypothetical protein